MMAYVHSVLRPSFLKQQFHEDFIYANFYERNKYQTRDLHTYKLPTREQGALITKTLCKKLSSVVPPLHSWTIND